MNFVNYKKIKCIEFIQREKEPDVSKKMELKKEGSSSNIMDKFISLGNGTKEKILSRRL